MECSCIHVGFLDFGNTHCYGHAGKLWAVLGVHFVISQLGDMFVICIRNASKEPINIWMLETFFGWMGRLQSGLSSWYTILWLILQSTAVESCTWEQSTTATWGWGRVWSTVWWCNLALLPEICWLARRWDSLFNEICSTLILHSCTLPQYILTKKMLMACIAASSGPCSLEMTGFYATEGRASLFFLVLWWVHVFAIRW